MSKKEILEGLKSAILELEEEKIMSLLKQGIKAGLTPGEMINDGLGVGLTALGESFEKRVAFLSDLMEAGNIMTEAVELLRPEMIKGGKGTGECMVIGTVQGDLHTIGRKIVAAAFMGVGYNVIDLGEDVSAAEFVKAIKANNATLVGASAILSPVKTYCEVINKAMVEAGVRDKVIYIIGGWAMTQLWCDQVGADAFGFDSAEALRKVAAIKSGESKKLKDRMVKK